MIYSPKWISKKVFTKVASQVDLLPTIAALTTKGYTNTTMGRDLLNSNFDSERYAFTIAHNKNPVLGLIASNYYFKVLADGSDPKLYATNQAPSLNSPLNSSNKDKTKYTDISPQQPQLTEKFKRLTLGIYETSKYMLYHNKSLDE